MSTLTMAGDENLGHQLGCDPHGFSLAKGDPRVQRFTVATRLYSPVQQLLSPVIHVALAPIFHRHFVSSIFCDHLYTYVYIYIIQHL